MGFGGSLMERRARSGAEGPDVTRAGSETRSQRIARYVNEAVLPFYVLHEPVIVAAAWVIVRWDAPLVAKYVALVVVSFAVTLGLYELLIRRCRIPRLLFGMKQVRA
jgi:peptidoglycan/LPS O-acetylase OafA/YrhL